MAQRENAVTISLKSKDKQGWADSCPSVIAISPQNSPFVFLLILLAIVLNVSANPLLSFVTKHATACERDTATLRCEDGSLIDVQRALYGRTDRST